MKFNINDNVRVKLTRHGRDILKSNHGDFHIPKKEDADGWSSWQLWILVQEFGDPCRATEANNWELPFETDIEIVESKS